MKTRQLTIEVPPLPFGATVVKREKFIQLLDDIDTMDDIVSLKKRILEMKDIITYSHDDPEGIFMRKTDGDTVSLRRDVLVSELDQVLEAQSLERARYYLRRLRHGVQEVRTGSVNDINLLRWKEYDNILTDSLWIFDKRDTAGAHLGWYWGNFIPQIPHQILLRYTKRGDWVLDPFVGSGTTLIECRRLGRNGIGVEISPEIAHKAEELIGQEHNGENVTTDVVTGDSRAINLQMVLEKHGIPSVQLLIMHPPYHDIVKFSQDENDLSQASTTEDFLKMFGEVVDNATPYLEKGHYAVLVIGDTYSKGEWVPLGFYCMNEVLQRGYILKSIIVKNFDETRGKRMQKDLWRYRALVGGFYIFKHEYVMIFKKK